MKMFLTSIPLTFIGFALILAKSLPINDEISDNLDQHNIDVNLNQNVNFDLRIKKNMKVKHQRRNGWIFPDYLLEVEPQQNYSHIYSTNTTKSTQEYNPLKSHKYSDDLNSSKYLELSVFVDFKAYQNMRSYGLIDTDNDFHELILSYINQIQAIYCHKSFVENFFINLVKIEIHKKDVFLNANGNRDELLTSFCRYQSDMNPESDTDALHWDMALLLTGHDLYVVKADGSRDYKSLGLGSVSGICSLERNCVITEFGPINGMGEVWPSSGLMSTWSAAHEMAHNLGIFHDGWPFNTDCPSDGYIMSSSRSTRGETNWSQCSAMNFRQSYTDCLNDRPIVRNERYDHNKYMRRPGMVWDADRQCKLFMRDNKAFAFDKTEVRICNDTILCVSPNKFGYYSSGPALEGTECGDKSWCVNGLCQRRSSNELFY